MKKYKIRIIVSLLIIGLIWWASVFYYNANFASKKKDKIDCNRSIELNDIKETTIDINTTDVNSETGNIVNLLKNYYDIKSDLRDPALLKEYAYEYNIISAFASKESDCSSILQFDKTDEYSYQLCKIYKSKDIAGLKAFKFDPKDKDMFLTMQSLIEGRYIDGADKNTYDSISKFGTLEKNAWLFDLKNRPDLSSLPYYIYLRNSPEWELINNLNDAFLKECEAINEQ